MNKASSPSRTYVAVISKANLKGYRFVKFSLPVPHENNTDVAAWYFLNRLDEFSSIDGCLTFEDYSNIKGEHDEREEEDDA